jgi:hypothetical protein
MAPRAVVARETELDHLRGFLAGGDAWSLVLRGEPGIGKTILWQTAVEEARALGRRVLVHRAVEAEAALAFSGLIDLVAPVLDEVADALPEPRARALRVALLLEAPRDEPPQPQAVGLALLDVLTALCESGDVVIALDDLQWLDSSTAAVLPLALRRVAGERLRVLATLRDAAGVRAPFELSAVCGEDRAVEIRLDAFSLSDLHHLLADRLEIELPRPQLARVHELSGGNPLYALELARAGDLRVPRSLRDALDARVAQLPEDTADVLLAAAALARPTLRAVAPGEARRRALVHALDAHVVELDGRSCASRTPCWRRAATSAPRHGGGGTCTESSPRRRMTSSSARATSHSPPTARTKRSPFSSTRPCTARPRVARPPRRPSSRSSPSRSREAKRSPGDR